MTTRAILKAEIIDDMERDATADGARVLSAISSAIKFYQPKRFHFNESRSITFPTVAGTDFYSFTTIGTEFYTIDGMFLDDGSSNVHELKPRDYRDMERLITTSATRNRPSTYSFIAEGLRFYAVPDAVYTIRPTGHVKIAEPANDSDTGNVWFTEAYELIRCRSKAYLYTHVFPNPEMALVMRTAEGDAFAMLKGASQDRAQTGYIEPTQF